MSVGLTAYSSIGSGTLATNAGSTTITVAPNSSTLSWDLVYVVVYIQGDPTGAYDLGDGWRIGTYYDAAGFGLVIAIVLATRAGSSGYAGIALPSSLAWTAQCQTLRIVPPGYFDLGGARFLPDTEKYSATASATTLSVNTGQFDVYADYVWILGRGYNNGGTTTTVGTISGTTERFDTGQVSPTHGIAGNDGPFSGFAIPGTVSSNLAAAKTNRIGAWVKVPIIGSVSRPQSLLNMRRMA